MNYKEAESTGFQQKMNRWSLAFLFMLPIAVISAASFIYFSGIGLPKGTKNKGELIVPPTQITTGQLKTAEGKPIVIDNHMSQWTFLAIGGSHCNEACKNLLWETRQTHIAMGKYQRNIRRIYLNGEQGLDEATQTLFRTEYPDLQVIEVDQASLDLALGATSFNSGNYNLKQFFIMDPQGFVMMRYGPSHTYKDVMADMKFLLRVTE